MKKIKYVLCLMVLFNFMYAQDYYKKIIVNSYEKEENAKKDYNKYKDELEKILNGTSYKENATIVLKKYGIFYVISVEPFEDFKNAKNVLTLITPKFKDAYINYTTKPIIKPKDINSSESNSEDMINEDLNQSMDKSSNSDTNKYTLYEMLEEIITTDPEIKEKLYEYKAILSEVDGSKARYYPTVDFIAKTGIKNHDDEYTRAETFNSNELTILAVQNLFDGFGTQNAVARDNARARAAYNKYIEVAQDKMFRATEAYLKVLRYQNILEIAKENVKLHEEILVKINKRYNEGFSTLSEVDRVQGRLSLAKSNLVSETNNLYDAKFNFHKALGRFVDENRLIAPNLDYPMPKTFEQAVDVAIHNNPSIKVLNEDIVTTQHSLEYSKKNDYPTVDIEVQATKSKNLTDASDGNERDLSAMLVLRYNLYNGGADKAEKQKYVSRLNYEYEHKNSKKREVIESLGLSWSAYKFIQQQRQHQVAYRDLTNKSQSAYADEFQLGRRTLIDLLDVQDEVNHIKIAVINSNYDLIFAKFRLLDATGELHEMYKNYFQRNNQLDKILAYPNQDGDNVLDVEDQCDNSENNSTNIYGCEKINCIKVQQIEFNKELKDANNTIDTSEVQNLWGLH